MLNIIKPLLTAEIFSNTLGNIVEWYDFTLYAALAPIIAHQFFPNHNAWTSLLLTFSAFAIGFLMRPLGGIIYGYIGDKFGRKQALVLSVIMMTVPTLIIGLLPTYARIGILAPVLITVVRLVQGMAVAGEFTGTISFLVEVAPTPQRGLAGSFALIGVLAGILLGSAVISLLTFFISSSAFASWGWRIPFCLGGVLGIIVFLLRSYLKETDAFITALHTHKAANNPLRTCFRFHKKAMLQAFGVTIFNAFAFYIIMVYSFTYFTKVIGISLFKATVLNSFMQIFTLLLIPCTGFLSDRIGRKKVLGLSALAFMILAYPFNILFLHITSMTYFFLLQALACFFLALYLGPLASVLAEIFSTPIRYTGLAVAFNIAMTLFGGTAPLIITFFIERTQFLTIPGILLTISAFISFITILFLRETARLPLA